MALQFDLVVGALLKKIVIHDLPANMRFHGFQNVLSSPGEIDSGGRRSSAAPDS
jgi:hypothetical protein